MTHGGYSSKTGTVYVAKCIVASGVLLCIAVRHHGEAFSLAEPLLPPTCMLFTFFFTRTNRSRRPCTDDVAENGLRGRAIWRHGPIRLYFRVATQSTLFLVTLNLK